MAMHDRTLSSKFNALLIPAMPTTYNDLITTDYECALARTGLHTERLPAALAQGITPHTRPRR
jgi:hypothetical protein